MPAKSKVQQKAAGAALSAKRGEIPKSKLVGASLKMYDSMTEKELDELLDLGIHIGICWPCCRGPRLPSLLSTPNKCF